MLQEVSPVLEELAPSGSSEKVYVLSDSRSHAVGMALSINRKADLQTIPVSKTSTNKRFARFARKGRNGQDNPVFW